MTTRYQGLGKCWDPSLKRQEGQQAVLYILSRRIHDEFQLREHFFDDFFVYEKHRTQNLTLTYT